MQRDMDLIRKILFVIEGKYVDTWLPGSDVQIDGYDMKTIAYHCALLHDAGLIMTIKLSMREMDFTYLVLGA